MTDITVTLGNRPELDAEERRARAHHAKDILSIAGWVFDDLISDLNKELLGTHPEESSRREYLYHQINGAAQAKGLLLGLVNQQAFEDKKNERKRRNDGPADHE